MYDVFRREIRKGDIILKQERYFIYLMIVDSSTRKGISGPAIPCVDSAINYASENNNYSTNVRKWRGYNMIKVNEIARKDNKIGNLLFKIAEKNNIKLNPPDDEIPDYSAVLDPLEI